MVQPVGDQILRRCTEEMTEVAAMVFEIRLVDQ